MRLDIGAEADLRPASADEWAKTFDFGTFRFLRLCENPSPSEESGEFHP
jgi:hypothetical protein